MGELQAPVLTVMSTNVGSADAHIVALEELNARQAEYLRAQLVDPVSLERDVCRRP